MDGKTSTIILRFHERPESWEILEASKHRLILQMFATTSYSYGEATKGWLENSTHPFVIDEDSCIVTETLESSIDTLIKVIG